MQEPLRLLHIEDDEDDAELVRRVLERDGFALAWERVDSEPQLREALKQTWDIAISDFAMPGFSGLRAFEILSQERSDLPFIFVSGALGEERAAVSSAILRCRRLTASRSSRRTAAFR